jgi:hypothetical protein
MAFGEIGRGAEDAKVAVLTGDTPGSNIDVPGIRSVSWNVESDSDEFEGDNSVIATVRNPKTLTGSIEVARMNLAAFAAMTGGTAATSGSTPNQIIALDESASAVTQYYQLIGQTYSQDTSGSGYRVTLNKLLTTSGPDESLTVNEWSSPTLDFTGVARGGNLLRRQNYETYTPIA